MREAGEQAMARSKKKEKRRSVCALPSLVSLSLAHTHTHTRTMSAWPASKVVAVMAWWECCTTR